MHDSFCGWYFKCQSDRKTLAVIPAVHSCGGEKSCSIQLITDDVSRNIPFSHHCFQKQRRGFHITVGDNAFGEAGIRLNLRTPDFSAVGSVRFGSFSPIRYDIMGPFCLIPFMECRHSVISMRHTVNGAICVNGIDYSFSEAVGYIEGDRGRSFPKRYAWTQCCHDGISLMLSVADIPLGGICFTGVIGVIQYGGREYRLATYLGARAVEIQNGGVVIRQGKDTLTVRLLKKRTAPLAAPVCGAMRRTIHESASCRAFYRLERNGKVLFSFETEKASFEYEYPF